MNEFDTLIQYDAFGIMYNGPKKCGTILSLAYCGDFCEQ
jgi:hypothetical protein